MSLIQQHYESISYPHYVHPQTDPARLAVIGRILGMTPADPSEGARVLDIGCGSATNLLAMAERLPGSRFVGIDFSGPDIASAQAIAHEAKLTNIELRQTDLMEWEPGDEDQFDYIIAYGFFSWVPDAVKERLLQVVSRCLSANGIACISYMTYPGCKQAEALRDLLRLRTEAVADPMQKVAVTHQTLDFLDRAWTGMPSFPHAGFMRYEAGKIRKKEPHFLLLDDLGVERDPCYLLQFTNWAAEHGLRYLGESEFHTMLLENLPPESAKELAAMGLDRLQTEQMLDYISNRSFRCTLLVGPKAEVSEGLSAQPLRQFCLSPKLFPKAKFRSGDSEGRFVDDHRSKVKLRSEPLVAFVTALANHKGALTPYPQILAAAEQLADRAFTEVEQSRLCDDLLTLYGRQEIEISGLPFQPPPKLPVHPKLTPLNQAICKGRMLLITARQDAIRLTRQEQSFCALLDGSRNWDELGKSEQAKSLGSSARLESLQATLVAAGCFATD